MSKKYLKLNKCIIAAALFLTLPMLIFGENSGIGSKFFSIGPRATYSDPKDADEGQLFAGAQARLHLTPVWALEGSIDYRRNHYSNLTTIRTYPVQASLLAYLMPGAVWSPFLLAGAGWYYTHTEGPNNFSKTTNRFGPHAGAGIEVMLSKDLSLDGSYRFIWLENVTSRDANALNKVFNDSGSMITLGLNFLFSFPTNAAQVKQEPKPAPVVESPNVVVTEKLIVLDDSHFEFNSSTLTPAGAKIVAQNAQVLRDNPETKIRIAGYASCSGTVDYNQKLSERRANAVREIFIKEGNIAPERLTTIGYGETRPAEHEAECKVIDSKEAKANMRVLFEIIVK